MRSTVRLLRRRPGGRRHRRRAPPRARNTAVSSNTNDGKSEFNLAVSVKKFTGDVDAQNTAVAYAHCDDCRTVAVAIQVVLVSGEVGSATSEHVAIAINYACTECETLARAFQFVYGDGQ